MGVEKLMKRASLTFPGMPLVVKPVVEQQHRAVLEGGLDGGQDVACRLVEIAVEVHQCDLVVNRSSGKRRGQRVRERPDVQDRFVEATYLKEPSSDVRR